MRNDCQVNEREVPGCAAPLDAELIAAGWQFRFIADAKRVQEAVEMYEELGQEVCVKALALEALREECHGCLLLLKQLKALYTRKKLKALEQNL